MSLGINATTIEGIVLAADSRASYRNQKGMARIGSDSASKIFKLAPRVGLIVAGLAFLPENGMPKNISNFIDDFVNQNFLNSKSVKSIGEKLREFFESKYPYQEQFDKLPQQIEVDLKSKGCEILEMSKKRFHVEFKFRDPAGVVRQGTGSVDRLQFILAGFNEDGSHSAYAIYIPVKKLKKLVVVR